MGFNRAEKDWLLKYWAEHCGGCFWCGLPFNNNAGPPTVEHFFPLSRGGCDHPDNVVLAHKFCNEMRWNRLPNEHEMRRFVKMRGAPGIRNLRLFATRLELLISGCSMKCIKRKTFNFKGDKRLWDWYPDDHPRSSIGGLHG